VPEQPQRLSPLAGVLKPGAHGLVTSGAPGVVISERHGLSIVQIAARRGQAEAAAAAIRTRMGVAPSPETGSVVAGERASALWIAPSQWLLVADGMAEGELDRLLREAVHEAAGVTDQSHARSVLRIHGPKSLELLAKGCPLDLDPRIFPVGRCAQAIVGPVAALLHAVNDVSTFDLYAPRGYALAFWQWLIESAAEFGYRVS
jgi:methylglutamate dehydrogenase subunit D